MYSENKTTITIDNTTFFVKQNVKNIKQNGWHNEKTFEHYDTEVDMSNVQMFFIFETF